MMINFKTNKAYFDKYFDRQGIWCRDIEQHGEYQLINQTGLTIMAISPDESLMALRDYHDKKQIIIYHIHQKQIIKTLPHAHYEYLCFSQDNRYLFILTKHGDQQEPQKSAPLCMDLIDDSITEFQNILENWGGLSYDKRQNCVYFYGFCVPKLYKFCFDELVIGQIHTDKKVKVRDCKVSHDGRGYYYMGSNHLIFMDNNDNLIWKMDLRTRADIKNPTILSFDICGNADFIYVYMYDRILICDLANDDYQIYKIGGAYIAPYFGSCIYLQDMGKHEILDLSTLTTHEFLPLDTDV